MQSFNKHYCQNHNQLDGISQFISLYSQELDPGQCSDSLQNHQSEQIIKNQKPPQKRRVSNYIFKRPLCLFKKLLFKQFKGRDFLLKQVKRICCEKNLTTFPKLVCLCQREGVRNQIRQLWLQMLIDYLKSQQKTARPEIIQQIKKWGERMAQSMLCTSDEDFVLVYWGQNVRHKQKLQSCIELVRKIREYQY